MFKYTLLIRWLRGYLGSLLHRHPAPFVKWSSVVLLLVVTPFLRIYSSVMIREDHPLYGYAILWMREEWKTIYQSRLSLAPVRSLGPHATSDSDEQHLTHYVPDRATRVFLLDGRPTWITFVEKTDIKGIRIFTMGSDTHLTRILDRIHRTGERSTRDGVKLMIPDPSTIRAPWWDPWMCVGWVVPTPLEGLAIENGLRTKITTEIKEFLDQGKGQFGILLHGPPGTGKTSLAKAIAAMFRLSLYQLSLTGQDGNALFKLSTKISHHSLFLLEDVDRVKFDGHVARQSEHSGFGQYANSVNLQSLLNVMDGAAAPTFAVIVITANNVENLPQVLVRAGRIDLSITMGLATTHQIEHIFRTTFKSQNHPHIEERAAQFGGIVPPDTMSPATIENFLKQSGRTPDTAIDDADQWVRAMTSSQEEVTADESKTHA